MAKKKANRSAESKRATKASSRETSRTRVAEARSGAESIEPGLPKAWSELLGVALLAIAGLTGAGVFSYQFGDGRLMGEVGALAGYGLYTVFGMLAYIVALGVLVTGIKCAMGRAMELQPLEAAGFVLATFAGCVLLSVTFPDYQLEDGQTPGGLVGEIAAALSLRAFGSAGTYLVGFASLCLGLLAATPLRAVHLGWPIRWLGGVAAETAGTAVRGAASVFTSSGEPEPEWSDDDSEERFEDEAPAATSPRRKKKSAPAALAAAPDADAASDIGEGIVIEAASIGGEGEARPGGADASPAKGKAARKNRRKKAGKNNAKTPVRASSPSNETEQGEAIAASTGDEFEVSDDPDNESDDAYEDDFGDDFIYDSTPGLPPEIVVSEEPDESAACAGDASARSSTDVPKAAVTRAASTSPIPTSPSSSGSGMNPVRYVNGTYELPPLELFGVLEKTKIEVDREFVLQQAQQIEESLAHFRIRGKVTKVHPGPVITRYEFKPEAGIKLSRIENLENDLAMALEAIRIRILAPIPGTSCVGFEVPNKERETVYVQEVMGDPTFVANHARLPLVLGKNITGKPVSIDLAKAPHLLVAGATGSGKSVGVNSMLCSLLYACTPEDLRLILIDPKMLEFSIYAGIPHLLLPVITDADRANLALRWVVKEMDRRYAVLSDAKVRDISGYNKKLPELQEHWEAEKRALEREAEIASQAVREEGEDAMPGSMLSGISFDAQGQAQLSYGGKPLEERPERMPYIVVVVDEFADLMMVASKEVEANVARIAAKARAAGIHLIVATQRPSVDVITGTIKNNFPSRIAFQVTSDVDSRTILDQKGAKQLLGMGDMLYMDRGKEPARVHGCFVSEKEIEKVVEFVSKQAKPAYNLEITSADDDAGQGELESRPMDPLYDKAVQIVAEAQKVSTSMIQRRLNVGYNRAAKIVEAMEEQGVIGPARGSQGREVYISAA